MTAAGQVRSEIVSRLKAAGLDAVAAYEDERFRERSGSVVAVGAKQAELAHAGLMNYLGEQYDAESGRTVEVYGRKLKMAASLDVDRAAGEPRPRIPINVRQGRSSRQKICRRLRMAFLLRMDFH